MLGKATSRLQACGSRLVDHVLTDARCAQANTPFVARPAPASVAYLQYTSGSISAPRGVMITHRNVITNLASIQDSFAQDEQSVSVSWLPHYHDMGLVYGLLQPLYSGFPAVVFPPSVFARTPETWLRTISRLRATHSGGPNFAYHPCVRRISKGAPDEIDLSSLRGAVNRAPPIPPQTLHCFPPEIAP